MIPYPDPLVSALSVEQASRAPKDPEPKDPDPWAHLRQANYSSSALGGGVGGGGNGAAGRRHAGTYHGRCPRLCSGGQALARGHCGDQARLGSGGWLGGTRRPWWQWRGLGLAEGGTHSWSRLLERVDG